MFMLTSSVTRLSAVIASSIFNINRTADVDTVIEDAKKLFSYIESGR